MHLANLPRIVKIVVGLATIAVSALGPVLSANAVTPSPNPGGGAIYGVGKPLLPSAVTPRASSITGGWTQRDFPSLGPATPSYVGMMSLTEPYRTDAGMVFDLLESSVQDNRNPASAPNVNVRKGELKCGTSEWSATSSTVLVQGSSAAVVINTGDLPYAWHFVSRGNSFNFDVGEQACPFVQSITVTVGFYKANLSPMQFLKTTWSAGDWATSKKYSDTPADTLMCSALLVADAPGVAGCRDVIIDLPTDRYCENPPAFDLTVPSSFGAWIGFYADCLFHPRAGFDRHGQVSTAMSESSFGELNYQFSRIGDAFQYATICGQIGGVVATGPLSGFGLNTCTWSVWAPPMKLAIGWAIILGFGWWAIAFVSNVVLSIFKISTPSPVGKEADK